MESELIVVILAALLAVSEALAFVPSVKANGVFQLVVELLKKAQALFTKK